MSQFELNGELPVTTTVLQASAGTGKTYAIAALAVRYLAEGVVSAEQLAVISFSRGASAELRTRVRERLMRDRDLLADVGAGKAVPAGADDADRLLCSGSPAQVSARLDRLNAAISGLDGATILTIHQFCQAMLAELGVLADQDPQATFTEDFGQLVDQVVEDLYVARYANLERQPFFDLATARELGRRAVDRMEVPLVPAEATGNAGERLRFADAVRAELARRKRRLGLYSYDDQLVRLRDSLRDATSEAAVERLRRRCQVVLVDEFQDTDPVQWEILERAFHGHRPLVLVGDPKQAIYGFRGADVTTYLAAAGVAEQAWSLSDNHRSDELVVAGVSALFENVLLGEGIGVPQVTAKRKGSRLSGPAPAPVRIRCVAASEPLDIETARRRIAADLVAEVVRLLSTDSLRLTTDAGPRPLEASDIAVLVNTNKRGAELASALTAAGVAVSFSGSESVFASSAATDWLTLLRALEEPRRQTTRAAVLTDFVGGDLAGLASADADLLADWGAKLQNWSRLLDRSGVAALFAAVWEAGLARRVLGHGFGDRYLTDYRHLAQLLHERHSSGVRGEALVAWLAEAIEAGDGATDRTRRLETDRRAVQILTVHKAKGLEFPVVLVPQASDVHLPDDDGRALVFHQGSDRVLDLAGLGARDRRSRLLRHDLEAAEDRLRGLYVACTRAQSQLTLWWAQTKRNTEASALHRLLFRDRTKQAPPQAAYRVDTAPGNGQPGDLVWLGAAGIAVEQCPPQATTMLAARSGPQRQLALASWDRQLDQHWRRTSYSGLTAAVHARPPFGLAGESLIEDEPASSPLGAPASSQVASPMARLPGGAAFGSLVHLVLENLDWHCPTPAEEAGLRDRLTVAVTDALRRYPVPGVACAELVEGLLPSLQTPLGGLTGGRSLCELPISDRLSELEFELPLGHRESATTLADVSDLLRQWLPTDDPLAGYASELDQPLLGGQMLRGFLTGSIDSVLRVRGPSADRFVVIDYKTNRISSDAELMLSHYGPAAMATEMIHAHYPLQAILYCVALHRFLAGRLPGYDPAVQLGGVGYLFVRGMAGRGEPEPSTGVFAWHPPAGLVTDLSELLADRRPR